MEAGRAPKLKPTQRVQKDALYDRPGNESEKVETTCCEQGSGRSQRIRRLTRSYRAVSKQWRDMMWTWLEPDGAALRLRHLCRQLCVLMAEWRRLCVGACPKAPAMPPTWPENASHEASTSSREGVGHCWRELREAYAVPPEDDPDLNVPMMARKKKALHLCRPSQASAGRSSLPSFNNNHNHNNNTTTQQQQQHNNNNTTTTKTTT